MALTYVATFTLFNANGALQTIGVGNGEKKYLDDPNSYLNGSGDNAELTFFLSGNCFSLNGNPLISFPGLPPGFTPLSASLRQRGSANTPPGAVSRGSLQNISSILTSYGVFVNSTTFAQTVGVSYPTISGLPVPTPIQLISLLQFTLSQVRNYLPSDAGLSESVFTNLEVYGFYSIVASRFALQNPTVPVKVGDKVKITSLTGGLDGITQVQLNYNDPVSGSHLIYLNIDSQNPSTVIDGVVYNYLNFIIMQQPDQFWFYMPYGIGAYSGYVSVTLVFDGTEFSGSVVAGVLDILFADVSGIYTLIDNQTNDIIYTRAGFTTANKMLMLSDMRESEIYENDFFKLLGYPYAVLSQDDIDEDFEAEDFSIIASQQVVTIPESYEIPSPFIKTAFLP